jgi:hypothetical protein
MTRRAPTPLGDEAWGFGATLAGEPCYAVASSWVRWWLVFLDGQVGG